MVFDYGFLLMFMFFVIHWRGIIIGMCVGRLSLRAQGFTDFRLLNNLRGATCGNP